MERLRNRKPEGGSVGGSGRALRGLGPVGLASFSCNMGKGLKEPCSPYREAYVFGAELNTPDANNWNCLPQVVDATNSFDLSLITPYHEVVVGIINGANLTTGLTVNCKWYRDRDNKLLFEFNYEIPSPQSYGYDYWLWYYVYTYIGYVPWEIWENGAYHLDFVAGGFSKRLNFTVTGIEEAGPSEQTVTLEPGESKTVSFEAIPYEAKTYQVSVNGLTGSFRAT